MRIGVTFHLLISVIDASLAGVAFLLVKSSACHSRAPSRMSTMFVTIGVKITYASEGRISSALSDVVCGTLDVDDARDGEGGKNAEEEDRGTHGCYVKIALKKLAWAAVSKL